MKILFIGTVEFSYRALKKLVELNADIVGVCTKDKSNFNLIVQLNHKELKKQVEKSDVIVLDLRLLESDHENEDIDSYTGIKILQKIHEINAGIQVIMLTATSKSTILEKLYEKKILGYIKKEHPEDKSIDTVENINKFINLVDKGLKRKYLKEVYNIQKSIKDILSNDIFAQYNLDLNFYEPFWIKLEKDTPKKLISEFIKLIDLLEFKKFIFLGSINKPWISKLTKKRKDYKPLIKTLDYFFDLKIDKNFNGGIEIEFNHIKDFLTNFYTITRVDGGFFDYYFSDINQNILFYLHYNGEFKILPLTEEINNKFLKIIKKTNFVDALRNESDTDRI